MSEPDLHRVAVLALLLLALPTFLVLMRITAPYGRHTRSGWGPTLPARLAWIVMESPAVIFFAIVYFSGVNALETIPLVFFCAWQFHYLQRTFLYPLRLRARGKRMPLAVVAMAIGFNVVNAYVNARWLSQLGTYSETWFSSWQFLLGSGLFIVGWTINQQADAELIRLRGRGESGYSIPQQGLHRYVSCPNYLGEIIEWAGWALATYSLAGAAFALFTLANLLPRALANHRWYRQEFADYPASRRALIPFVL